MLEKIISGGQTGADQGALLAACAFGIPTGGWAPKGWKTETGPAPWLADFGLVECPEPGYAARRRLNVRDCHAALLFGDRTSPGSLGLLEDCRELGKPWIHVADGITRPSMIVEFLRGNAHVRVLLVAGDRESRNPGIGDRVAAFLYRVFRQLGIRPVEVE